MKLVIVTGMSGSGKSIALHTLEDLGYYCIDNLPVQLLLSFAEQLLREQDATYKRTAVGIDARSRSQELDLVSTLARRLRDQGIACEIVYLDAEHETLLKRFSETRRRHPLSDGAHGLDEALRLERELMAPLRGNADLQIDTSHTNVHQLRDLIRERLGEPEADAVSLMFQSFGFKHSVPRDTDFVFDVRCLPNPYWQVALRPFTGRDRQVREFLEADPQVLRMRQDLIGLLESWIPKFEADGRSYLTISIGCTGGQHRSVYIAEQLSQHFRQAGRRVLTRHRELSP